MLNKKLVFLLYYYYSTVLLSVLAEDSNSNYISFPAKENGTCYKRVPYNDDIAAKISKGIVKIDPSTQYSRQQAGVKTSNNRVWVTIIDCCDGYARNPTSGQCETHCDEGCLGGTCTGANVCICPDGYHPEAGICKAVCRRGCPAHSYCFSPDYCSCEYGYEKIDDLCKPVCLHGCTNGDCIAPKDCRCHSGFFLNETQRCEPVCEGGCPHGECSEPGICSCYWGYVNPPNDRESCVPSCPDTCTNGQCYSPGVCTCKPGYVLATNGTCVSECQNDCLNGRCVAPDQCECNPGFVMHPQLRRCVENHAGDVYENSMSNKSYENSYVTIPPDVLYGNRDTPGPQILNQVLGTNATVKGRQLNHTHDTLSPVKAHGTQSITNRNVGSSKQQSLHKSNESYENYESNQTEDPPGVIGLKGASQVHNNYGNNKDYGNYRYNQTQERGYFSGPGSTSTPDSDHTSSYSRSYKDNNQTHYPTRPNLSTTPEPYQRNDPFEAYGYNKSYHQEQPYTPQGISQKQNSRSLNSNNQNHRSQGPFPPLEPHTLQEQNQSQNSYDYNNPYGVYVSNDTHQPRRPYNPQDANQNYNPHSAYGNNQRKSQGPFPPLESRTLEDQNNTQSLHGINDSYGGYRNNHTFKPLNSHNYSSQEGLYPTQELSQFPESREAGINRQNPYNINHPYGNHGGNMAHRPQGPHTSQGPFPAQGANSTPEPYNANNPYANQGRNPTYRPQGVYDSQGMSSTPDPRNINDPYGDPRGNPAYRPQGPYSSQRPFSPQVDNSTPDPRDLNGPYGTRRGNPSYRPQETFSTQAINSTPDPRNINGPYGSQSNPTYRPQGAYDSQGMSSTADPRNINDPYGDPRGNPAYRPQGPYSSQRPFSPQVDNSTPDPRDLNGPYGTRRGNPTYRPQETFSTQGINSTPDPRNINGPYGSQSNPTYRPQGFYSTQGVNQPQNPYQPSNHRDIQGVKTSHRRPGTTQNPGLVDLAYGPHEIRNPENNGPFGSPRPYQPQRIPGAYDPYGLAGNDGIIDPYNLEPSLTHGLHEPYNNPYNRPGSGNIGVGYVVVGAPIPGPSQFGQICEIPCLNADCVGPNLCACRQGYEPDPTSPFGNVCVPVCLGGCLNGVCSAPNLCICNVGYIKERGVKSSAQRCVPTH